jgi:hypothetical protein
MSEICNVNINFSSRFHGHDWGFAVRVQVWRQTWIHIVIIITIASLQFVIIMMYIIYHVESITKKSLSETIFVPVAISTSRTMSSVNIAVFYGLGCLDLYA